MTLALQGTALLTETLAETPARRATSAVPRHWRRAFTLDAWVADAACRLGDARRLDPIINGRPGWREVEQRAAAAYELCGRCPVRVECGAAADEHGDPGVRGGSLRYEARDLGGHYVADPLIPTAAPSRYDRARVEAELGAQR